MSVTLQNIQGSDRKSIYLVASHDLNCGCGDWQFLRSLTFLDPDVRKLHKV